MNDIAKNVEFGDFMLEFDGRYLGSGQCRLDMSAVTRDIRRDALQPLRGRQLKAIQWSITADLDHSETLWQLLAASGELSVESFSKQMFSQGAVLKLYPLDPRREGFCFDRVFLDEACEYSGEELKSGRCHLKFTGEAVSDSINKYFTRMSAGARPAGLPMRSIPNAREISLYLLKDLTMILDAVDGQTLLLNGFAPGGKGSYNLELVSCRNWSLRGARILSYKLTGRFPEGMKKALEQKMFECSLAIHGHYWQFSSEITLIGQVEKLNFNDKKIIDGKTVVENKLEFVISVD